MVEAYEVDVEERVSGCGLAGSITHHSLPPSHSPCGNFHYLEQLKKRSQIPDYMLGMSHNPG
jgi:hypothetical protein